MPLLLLVEYYLVKSTTQTPIKEKLVLNRYSLALVLCNGLKSCVSEQTRLEVDKNLFAKPDINQLEFVSCKCSLSVFCLFLSLDLCQAIVVHILYCSLLMI